MPKYRFLTPILMFLLLMGCSSEKSTWERIEEDGILRIGMDPTYPPFEMYDGESLFGLDVDLAHAITADLGLIVEFVHFGYDGLYDGLSTKQVDVLISALVVLPHQLRDFAYTSSYFNAGQVIVSRDDNQIEQPSELEGKVVAVEIGAQGHLLATTWKRNIPDIDILTFSTPDDAIAAVSSGNADAAVVDNVSGRLYLQQASELRISTDTFSDENYAIVVRAEDETLLEILNHSLANLRNSGRLDRIISRWLDQ